MKEALTIKIRAIRNTQKDMHTGILLQLAALSLFFISQCEILKPHKPSAESVVKRALQSASLFQRRQGLKTVKEKSYEELSPIVEEIRDNLLLPDEDRLIAAETLGVLFPEKTITEFPKNARLNAKTALQKHALLRALFAALEKIHHGELRTIPNVTLVSQQLIIWIHANNNIQWNLKVLIIAISIRFPRLSSYQASIQYLATNPVWSNTVTTELMTWVGTANAFSLGEKLEAFWKEKKNNHPHNKRIIATLKSDKVFFYRKWIHRFTHQSLPSRVEATTQLQKESSQRLPYLLAAVPHISQPKELNGIASALRATISLDDLPHSNTQITTHLATLIQKRPQQLTRQWVTGFRHIVIMIGKIQESSLEHEIRQLLRTHPALKTCSLYALIRMHAFREKDHEVLYSIDDRDDMECQAKLIEELAAQGAYEDLNRIKNATKSLHSKKLAQAYLLQSSRQSPLIDLKP